MNRQIIYIIAGLLFCGISLSSCDKEYFAEQENNGVIGTEDANVPKGYVRVSFPDTEDAQTRAAASGNKTTIANLWYLRYKKVGGNFILDKKSNPISYRDWGNITVWPFKHTDDMLIGETYKVVFLGNMTKELFGDGKGNDLLTKVTIGDAFDDARINAPESGFLSDKVFYFCCPAEFTIQKSEGSNTMSVPVALKRLVSRYRLTTYGIPSVVQQTVDKNVKDYSKRFYASCLEDAHPMKLSETIFSNPAGTLGVQFREQLQKDIIFPVAYMLATGGKLTSTNAPKVSEWYNSVKESYWSNYTKMTEGDMKTLLQSHANSKVYYKDVISASGKPEALCQFIEALYTGEGSYVANMLAQIKTSNIRQFEPQGTVLNHIGSFTIAKQQVVSALSKSGKLATWDDIMTGEPPVEVGLKGTVPQSLDFNLESKETRTLSATKMNTLSYSTFEDRMVELLFLGDKIGSANWTINSLHYNKAGDLSQPTNGVFPAGTAALNTSKTYRVSPTSMTLGSVANKAATPARICYSYGELIKSLETYPNGLEAKDLNNIFCDALAAVYGLPREGGGSISLDRDCGLIRDAKGTNNWEQYGINFYVPDFASANFAIEMGWKEE